MSATIIKGARITFPRLIKPAGVAVRRSESFGGGWAWALDAEGKAALWEFFGEGPGPIPVADAEGEGYIIEPHQTGDLAANLSAAGITWETV